MKVTDPLKAKIELPKEDSLDQLWTEWSQKQNKQNMMKLMDATRPVMEKAVTTYAPKSPPAVRSYARLLTRQAIQTFDPKHGVKFKTYLFTQLQPLRREAGLYDTLHVPERIRFDRTTLNQKNNEFVDEHGREPNEQELADFSGISVKRLQHVRKYDRMQLPEDVTRAKSDEEDEMIPEVAHTHLATAFVYEGLNDRDKLIYDLKTGKGGSQRPLTVNEIAAKLGITASAVSQRLSMIDRQIAEVSSDE